MDHIPLFSSYGLRHYYSTLTAHYGAWHAQLPGKRTRRWVADGDLHFGMLCKIKLGPKLQGTLFTHSMWHMQDLAGARDGIGLLAGCRPHTLNA